MNYIFDIAAVLILLIAVSNGAKRGIVQMIISLAGVVVAFAAAAYVSNVCTDYVYEHAVRPIIMDVLETKTDEAVSEYDPAKIIADYYPSVQDDEKSENYSDIISILTDEEFHDKLEVEFNKYCDILCDKLEGTLPDEIIEKSRTYVKDNNPLSSDMTDFMQLNSTKISEMLEVNIVRPIVVKVLHTIIFSLVFLIVSIAFNIIGRVTGFIKYIPAINSVNKALGGVLGFVYGLLWLVVFVIVLSLFIKLTSDMNTVINTEIISQTYFFKWLYYGILARF